MCSAWLAWLEHRRTHAEAAALAYEQLVPRPSGGHCRPSISKPHHFGQFYLAL
jgi:hypothetical protein